MPKRPPPQSSGPETQFTTRGLAMRLVELDAAETSEEVFRVIKHYSNHGILNTVGAVHTGTGKSRVYPENAVAEAAILLRLNKLGLPVGVMQELFRSLRTHLAQHFAGQTLTQAARTLDKPCVFFVLPDDKERSLADSARLYPLEKLEKVDELPPDYDLLMIQLARFL